VTDENGTQPVSRYPRLPRPPIEQPAGMMAGPEMPMPGIDLTQPTKTPASNTTHELATAYTALWQQSETYRSYALTFSEQLMATRRELAESKKRIEALEAEKKQAADAAKVVDTAEEIATAKTDGKVK
jgi:hypothetical protein